jgi:prolyl oligopeptidase
MSIAIDDPFGHLEDGGDPRTVAWTAEQNVRMRQALDGLAPRGALTARFESLLDTGALGVPVERGERIVFTARRGRAEQPSLYVREAGVDRVLLDPSQLDPSNLTAIDWWYASPLGTYVAFGLSQNGSERSTLAVIDVADGRRHDDAIPDTRFASLAWLPDESGFYYTRRIGGDYDARLFRHVLGAAWQSDREVFGAGRKPEESLTVALCEDGRWLSVTVQDGWSRGDVYIADTRAEPLRFVPMVEGRDAMYGVVPTNDAIYVHTDEGAPRFRVMLARPERPERELWQEVVPEGDGKLEEIAALRGALALHYLENVHSVVRIRYDDARLETLHAFDGHSVVGWSSSESSSTMYVLHSSFFEAGTISRIDTSGPVATTERWDSVATPFEPGVYESEQMWFVSKDGTRVPMFVLARRGTPRDGTAPAVLNGYGGFNISLVPAYLPSVIPWLDAGGIYAIANLRGGGEFGETWHRAGMLESKQNVFDDFIAAATFLAESGLADPARIALLGGSNGGLLVAAIATQRPELARAIVCLVPLTDMLRFTEFSIARLWISEYGDPSVPSDAAVLRAYSPYHNVRDGTAYPAMLIATAEDDSRVDPMHARKFAARVQEATSGTADILLAVEPNAGHGAGKPRRKVVAELVDRWSFIGWQLGGVFG